MGAGAQPKPKKLNQASILQDIFRRTEGLADQQEMHGILARQNTNERRKTCNKPIRCYNRYNPSSHAANNECLISFFSH